MSRTPSLPEHCGPSAGSEQTERVRLIRNSPLFSDLPTAEISRLAMYARRRCFARNEVLFMQGECVENLVLLESGWVKITQTSPSGSEVILATCGPGQIVDLPSGSNADQHHVGARTAVGCIALTWIYPMMRDLVTPSVFNHNLCGLLAKQCYELQERYHEMSTERVERRVARTLIRLAAQCGTRTYAGVEVCISRQDLASMTGTTLFAVSRLISRWSKYRLIAAGREAFLMLDAQGLDALTSAEKTCDFGAMLKTQDRPHAQRLC